ncbi:MAG: hypothetical protein ACOY40_18585 [Bacillota bacterium]
MRGNLVLIWQEENVGLVFGQEKIVLAAEQFSLASRQDLKEIIKRFLAGNSLSPFNIKNVIVVADLTALLPQKLQEDCLFGYLRVTPASFEFPPVTHLLRDSALKLKYFHLPLPGHPEHGTQISKALSSLSGLSVKSVAINSTFSLIDPSCEKLLIEEGEKLFPGRFCFYPSYNYNTPNFLLRENVLLINLFLSGPVESFLSWLRNSFGDCSVTVPFYFLKGDGTLTTISTVEINPLLTWQSNLASHLLGGSCWAGRGEAIILVQEEPGLCIGLTENFLPKLAGSISSFHGLELPGKYPLNIHLKEMPNNLKWEETLEFINPFPGPIPVVSFVPYIKVSPVFRYPLVSIPAEPCVQGSGALTAPYRLEIEKVSFFSQPHQSQVEKQELWDIALWQMNQGGVQLAEINHRYEELSLRYLPQNPYLLRLVVWGKLK